MAERRNNKTKYTINTPRRVAISVEYRNFYFKYFFIFLFCFRLDKYFFLILFFSLWTGLEIKGKDGINFTLINKIEILLNYFPFFLFTSFFNVFVLLIVGGIVMLLFVIFFKRFNLVVITGGFLSFLNFAFSINLNFNFCLCLDVFHLNSNFVVCAVNEYAFVFSLSLSFSPFRLDLFLYTKENFSLVCCLKHTRTHSTSLFCIIKLSLPLVSFVLPIGIMEETNKE